MPPTGMLLAAFAESTFAEKTVRLEAGDFFVLFTDGLVEAGPSRGDLLGIPGIADLMRRQDGAADANHFTASLMSNVSKFTRGTTDDDIALLVGKVL